MLDAVVHTFNPSTGEAEVGRSLFGASLIYSKFKNNQKYIVRPFLKNQKQTK